MTEHLSKLKKIHGKVFHNFTYKTDLEKYKELEHWAMPDESTLGVKVVGDCEDFALSCRALCREAGIPTRLIFCVTETGEGHCVLECEGYILDNRYNRVKSRNELDYRWLSISGYEPGDEWHKIEH